MFGWFKPTCPCDPAAKRWVEDRLRWLSQQFGMHVLLEKEVVVPTDAFFPDAYDGSPKTARRLFRRVCQLMGVNTEDVRLEFFDDKTPRWMNHLDPSLGFAAGTWEGGERQGYYGLEQTYAGEPLEGNPRPSPKGTVRIERGALDRPADLIGTLAHELAHQRLLAEGRANPQAFDNELLTDLTAVYFGFGVFLANNPRKSTGELGKWPGTDLHRPEYLSEPMLGYALALLAWFRDESWPKWAGHLRGAPRAVFKQGLRFLQKVGASSFRPVRFLQEHDPTN